VDTPAPGQDAARASSPDKPHRILVAYATRHGSTADVAEWIGDGLRVPGSHVDVVEIGSAPRLADYDAVVVGGPMILGWHRAARRFLGTHAGELEGRPVALFITCASLTETGEDELDGIPITKDPWLVKKPRTQGRLTRKERYACPVHYLEGARKEAPDLHLVGAAFFGGSLDLTSMNLFEKLFVTLVIGATPGDSRNQAAVREWAGSLVRELKAG